ncbi:hypothetical protein [Saccharopolyspora taberi]|uniref:Uncharacterized protein n=1 Tax=Saccharopolyspora taberi TaxID=60895 RepID=A0ABN3V1F7_9PSEU
MPELITFTIPADSAPEPGEVVSIEQDGYLLLVENTHPPVERADDAEPPATDKIVKYVPVDITARSSVVRHAAAVYQRRQKTRVNPYTLCDRSGGRKVDRRLDHEPLTNVTCAQCRKVLIDEGLLN